MRVLRSPLGLQRHREPAALEVVRPEWLGRRGQPGRAMARADRRDLDQGRLVVAADQQHLAVEIHAFEIAHYFDGVGLSEREVEDNEVGWRIRDLREERSGVRELLRRKTA